MFPAIYLLARSTGCMFHLGETEFMQLILFCKYFKIRHFESIDNVSGESYGTSAIGSLTFSTFSLHAVFSLLLCFC